METVGLISFDVALTVLVVVAIVQIGRMLGYLWRGGSDGDGGQKVTWNRPPQPPRNGPHSRPSRSPLAPAPVRPRSRR